MCVYTYIHIVLEITGDIIGAQKPKKSKDMSLNSLVVKAS